MLDIKLDELTFENIGSWPPVVKWSVIGLAATVIVFLGFYFDTRGQLETLRTAEKRERILRTDFEKKQQMSVNLNAYRKQLAEIRAVFNRMLQQLPNRTEIPGLLEDISKTGVASGLVFKLFDPLEVISHDFYSELPIKMAVVGNYHQLATFVSRVAHLPRIVTMHEMVIVPVKNKSGTKKVEKFSPSELLRMNITAKIYQYLDTDLIQRGA